MIEPTDTPASTDSAAAAAAERASRYVARILQQQLADGLDRRGWVSEGTAAFVDVSGFTALSERLARKGKEGAEQITDAIGARFESILEVAYENGGSLLKFGGDALLLWFDSEGHAARACRAMIEMRRVLRDVGRIEVPGAKVVLRMAQGVHSGRFQFFAVGTSHRELLTTGPAWSELVVMEQAAGAGEVVVSPGTAAMLSNGCVGDRQGPGFRLRREPSGRLEKLPLKPRPKLSPDAVAHCLPTAVRAHVLAGGGTPEHRPVTIAFIRFAGTDALIERDFGAAVDALHRTVSTVQAAADEQGVTFLASDVDADGGKLILTAGAPKITGDDEERMLLALRRIVETDHAIPIRIGLHRGSVFAGDIGPFYRRTYTVMGDAVNLSARLMAGAEPALIYATADVLDRSNTLFETTELAPLGVKGKAKPVKAWSVGKAKGSRTRNVALQPLPLVGRDAELGVIRDVIANARSGTGRLIEVAGEAGIGKTRLMEALRDDAAGFHLHHAVCEAYTASTPYAVWRELLREFMGFGRDDSDALVAERLRDAVATRVPDLAPWLPLIAIPFGVDVPPTPEVEMLAEKNRRAKLHETLGRFLAVLMSDPQLIEIEDAHHMDGASAELLSYLTRELAARPWLFGVARRSAESGFVAPESPAVARIELTPLAPQDAIRLTRLATEEHPLHMHVVEVVALRSGGNPQFLRDLARSAITSGGIGGLPDSAQAAAMAQIDSLAPDDRALVRRAAVFGQAFHPRMLSWLTDDGDGTPPGPETWERLQAFFSAEADGYLRFRRSLLRDAAYEGLPYKLRRQLHGAVAARIAQEADDVDEAAGILSLHYLIAGDNRSAWRYATVAGKHAASVYAYVEAARLYSRALEAGRRLEDVGPRELAAVQRTLGDAWYQAAEFKKAADAYTGARKLVASDALAHAELLLKLSHVEEKLGRYPAALRWVDRARVALKGAEGFDATRHAAAASVWYATVLQAQGRTADALKWAERGALEAEDVDDPEVTGDAYMVMGWGYSVLGKEGGEAMMLKALDAYRRSGNRVRQASILSNLGAACYWDGRWDDAMAYYERGRDELVRVGDLLNAAVASLGIAEILSDRGELAEAESTLQKTVPMWKASDYHYFLGYCIWMLGRVSLRGNKVDEARSRFAEARALMTDVGALHEVLDIDARLAECHLLKGEPAAAFALADGILAKPDSSGAIARLTPQLNRVRGYAMLMQADRPGARAAFETSLAVARKRKERFEVALTSNALIELDRLEGVEPPQELVDEGRAAIANLRIRALPAAPAFG